MGLFSKIGKGFKKLGSFVGKVTKGIAQGGLVGGAAAFVSNVGGGSKAQKATFASNSSTLSSTTPASASYGGIVITTEEEKRKRLWTSVGIGAAILAVLYFMFRRKRR